MRISQTMLIRVLSCSFRDLHVGARTWLQAWAIVERFFFLGRQTSQCEVLISSGTGQRLAMAGSACADLPACSQQLLTRGARRARAPVGAPRERRRGQEAAARGTLRALRHLRQAAAEEGAPTAPAPGAGSPSPSRITQAPGRGAVARADCTASPLQLQFFFSGDNFYLIIS